MAGDEISSPGAQPAASLATSSHVPANRWAVLALLGVAQLMVVLDVTIVNIALPSAQKALQFSADDRQWIITAYALTFGSLLLLGGKLGDMFGRNGPSSPGCLSSLARRRLAAWRHRSMCWSQHGHCRDRSGRCWPRRRCRC